MTLNVESNASNPLNQENIDTTLSQQQVDTKKEHKQEAAPAQDEKPEDPNWKAFREARKKDRADREAAERRAAEKEAEATALKAAMEAAFAKQAPQQQYQEFQPAETEEERIDKRVKALLAERESQYAREMEMREQQQYPQRLNQNYPDINQVCSQENLDYLDYHFPEVSRPLQRLKEGYDKWSDIYHAIKKFVPNNTNSKREAARADINQNKPKSISSTGITQSGEGPRASFQETEQRRAANWERMKRTLNGI